MSESIKPEVIIYCITYNHKMIIRKCLDGFLMQKTDFPYEIWIHDDCSTDGTVEILKEYEKKYPEIINVVYEDENQRSKGISIASIMLPKIKNNCKYIATCEGDDYWIDEYKLQKQYDFMEKNSNYSMCVHSAEQLNLENGTKRIQPSFNEDKTFTIKDIILLGGGYFPTCTFFTRNNFEIIPRRWGIGIVGDLNEIMHAALNGNVYCMHNVMSVKTDFLPGSWSSRHRNKELMRNHILSAIDSFNRFNEEFNYVYDAEVQQKILTFKYRIECEIEGNYKALFTNSDYKQILKGFSTTQKSDVIC